VLLVWAPFLTFKKWGSSFESPIDFDPTLNGPTRGHLTMPAMVHDPSILSQTLIIDESPYLVSLSLPPFEETLRYPTLTTSVGGRG